MFLCQSTISSAKKDANTNSLPKNEDIENWKQIK